MNRVGARPVKWVQDARGCLQDMSTPVDERRIGAARPCGEESEVREGDLLSGDVIRI